MKLLFLFFPLFLLFLAPPIISTPNLAIIDPGISSNSQLDKDYALLFAVDSYTHLSPLVNPIKDATEIAAILKSRYGFNTEIVENPSREEINEKLQEYRRKYDDGSFDPTGQLLIFFSGHGMFDEDSENGFFMAADSDPNDLYSTSIPYSIWRPYINKINCRRILVTIDACYSGTFDQKIAMREGRQFGRINELSDQQKFLYGQDTLKARKYLVSGAKEKTPDKSSFAKKLLEGLRNGGGKPGLLTAGQLHRNYVQFALPLPHFDEFGDDDAGSTFLFFDEDNKAYLTLLHLDLEAWKNAEALNTSQSYQDYLQHFPEGQFASIATSKINQLKSEEVLLQDMQAWQEAKKQDTRESYETYIRNFPNGEFRKLADNGLQKINPVDKKEKTTTVTPPSLTENEEQQTKPPTTSGERHGHINRTSLLDEMEEVKTANQELEAYQEELKGYLQKMYLDFQRESQKFTQENVLYAPSVREAKESELKKRQQELLSAEQESQQKIMDKREKLFSPIFAKVNAAVQAVADENGFTFIFDSSESNSVAFARQAYDITPLVKTKLAMSGGINSEKRPVIPPTNSNERYGHFNKAAIMAEMPEMKNAERELDAFQKKATTKGQKMMDSFQQAYQKYQSAVKGGQVSPSQQAAMETDLKRQQQAIQAYDKEMKQQIESEQNKLYAPIYDKIEAAVQDVAKENGFSFILDSSESNSVAFAKESNDITQLLKAKLGIQ